jgi:hypothetical protein
VSIPTPAERARTILRSAPCLRVRTPGAWAVVDLHGTDPDGSVVLVLAEESPVVGAVRRAGADLPVLVDAADLCPVPVADRVRGRLRLVGWVHEPAPTLRRELALVAADREGAGALLDIGRGRTVLYVDVVEALVADGGADPDDVGAVTFLDPDEYRRPGRTRWPAPRRRCSTTSSPATRPSCSGWPSSCPGRCATAPSRSRWTATGWSCAAVPATCGSRSGRRCAARASCRGGYAS